jgi:hypothetical protein
MKGLMIDKKISRVTKHIRDIDSQNLKAVPACHLILLEVYRYEKNTQSFLTFSYYAVFSRQRIKRTL